MKKRITGWLCLACVVLGTAVSCGETETPVTSGSETVALENGTVTEAETEDAVDPALRDSLPEADLGGAEFRLTVFGMDEFRAQTWSDGYNGNIVNDAVYEKITSVEERFNTDIVLTEMSYGEDNGCVPLKTAILAGEDTCDLAQAHDLSMANFSLEGMCVNVLDIPHLDFSKPWWPSETMDSMTVSGQMYVMCNNLSFNNLAMTRVLFFNKTMMAALDYEYPYAKVADGTWTMEVLTEMSNSAYSDLNGNGKPDNDDRFGYYISTFFCYMEPYRAEPFRKNADGDLIYEFPIERTALIVEKMAGLLNGAGAWRYQASNMETGSQTAFANGNSLFLYAPLGVAASILSDSALTYGILPMPKLQESDDGYYSGSTDRPFAVPITAEGRLDNIGLVIEALNAEGYRRVYPAYFEISMKSRYADQQEDAQMLDIIHDNMIISFSYLYSDGVSSYNALFDSIYRASGINTDVASWAAKREKSNLKRLGVLTEFFDSGK